jgi:transketolase
MNKSLRSVIPEGMKTALHPVSDAGVVRELQRSAIQQRRNMLELGQRLKIRLHYGAMMSCVEILTLLYQRWLQIDPLNPAWPERDRFVLSKGHAAPALYMALCLAGFFPPETFRDFRSLGSPLQGHPDRNKTLGVDCSTGSLGQGFPVACGMALGAALVRFPFRVYTLLSDGECNEGSIWEAALIAANLKIGSLTALLDWNGKSSYGPMQGRNDILPLADKWKAFGWHVLECDGHDFLSLSGTLEAAERVTGQPAVILCRTQKGRGIPFAETHPTRSNFSLTEGQYRETIASLDQQEQALQ